MFILLLHRSYIIFGIYINIIFFHVPKLSINIYKNSFRGSCELDGQCMFASPYIPYSPSDSLSPTTHCYSCDEGEIGS